MSIRLVPALFAGLFACGTAAAGPLTLNSAPRPAPVSESARNRFVGIITRVIKDGVAAQVEMQAGPYRIVSLITRESVDELGLRAGVVAVASVKATNVGIELPRS